MAMIKLLENDEMENDVLHLSKLVAEQYGFVPNILRAIANCPDIFRTFVPFWAEIYRSSHIGRRRRAIAALATAFAQECQYCIGPMTQSAVHAGLSDSEIRNLRSEHLAGFDPKEALIYRYGKALTLDPSNVDPEIKTALRKNFTDGELVNITLAIGMYNLTSRFLKGLEIDLDQDVKVRGFDRPATSPAPMTGDSRTPMSHA
jgi:uncharacterized peroxidase-related enzyme